MSESPNSNAQAELVLPETAMDSNRRLVVLPFKNLGDPNDDYFAAGMTEELRSRLASVPDLEIISGQSAAHYSDGQKSTREIGAELGVNYIVTGTFRWARDADGTSRIRFTPGLVNVKSDAELWSDVIDARIEDVFYTQSRIASQVVRQLGITLFDEDIRDSFDDPVTDNLNAYQHYLRGVYLSRPIDWSQESLDAAIVSFEKAVHDDPDFGESWAGLARAHAAIHTLGFDTSPSRCALAHDAVDRAEAISSEHKATALAAGYYFYWCEQDFGKALASLERPGLEVRNDDEMLSLLSNMQRRQGRWEESLKNRRLAARLDPMNLAYLRKIAATYTYMRRYSEAISTCDRLSTLEPDQRAAYSIKANNLWLWKGQDGLAAARIELEHAPDSLIDWWRLLIFEGRSCEAVDMVDDYSREWVRLGADAYPREYLLARAQEICGQPQASETYQVAVDVVRAEMARVGTEDFRLLSTLGRALARLGENETALQAARRSVELLPVDRDSLWGPTMLRNLAEVCAIVGETVEALTLIEQLLDRPAWFSVEVLELDPVWAPLRTEAGYQELVRRHRLP